MIQDYIGRSGHYQSVALYWGFSGASGDPQGGCGLPPLH